MALWQIRVDWTGPSSPLMSNFYFDVGGGGTTVQAAAAVAAFMTSLNAVVSPAFSWAVNPEVRQINDATGELQAVITVGSTVGVGTLAGERFDLLQGLVTWNTGVVVDGRVLKGRMFIPGPTEGSNEADGTPTAGYVSAINSAAATMIADVNSELDVWHRPKFDPETGVRIRDGSQQPVTAGSTANRWSYLKTRRQ